MSREAQLEDALRQIGNLPMEFNSRARAIAQNSVTPPEGGWRDTFTLDQIGKLLRWDGRELWKAKEKAMSTETKETISETKQVETGTEEPKPYIAPQIEMIPVTSSNLKGFGHDGDKTLRVWFLNDTAYDYPGADEDQFFALVNAESPGKAYNVFRKESGILGIKI